jgi:hypothetical protein
LAVVYGVPGPAGFDKPNLDPLARPLHDQAGHDDQCRHLRRREKMQHTAAATMPKAKPTDR